MRVRKQDSNGDVIFGHGGADYYVNTSDAVALAVKTRLLLFTGEWFLDLSEGTPWATRVLGKGRTGYDAVIKARILGTEGVLNIVPGSYASVLSGRKGRRLDISCTLNTIYGQVQLTVAPAVYTPIIKPTIVTQTTGGGVLDFSDAANSGYVALLF